MEHKRLFGVTFSRNGKFRVNSGRCPECGADNLCNQNTRDFEHKETCKYFRRNWHEKLLKRLALATKKWELKELSRLTEKYSKGGPA